MSVKISSLNTASTINSGDDINIAGNNPLTFSDWGGGWFMQDGTYIRSLNQKSIWLGDGVLASQGGLSVGYGGTLPTAGYAIIAGSVGIGTSNPLHKLEVAGNISINGGSYLDFANGDVRFVNSSGLLSVQTYSLATGLTTKMVVTGSGNVGIGTTTPIYRFEVSDGTRTGIINPNASLDGIFLGVKEAKPLVFGTTDTERMRITSGGALLIGTTSTTNTAAGKIVNRLGGTSNPDLVLNGGGWSIASIGGEPALYLSSNIVAATGIPGATQTAKGGMGFEYSSATSPTDLVLGIFGTPTVASSVKIFNSTERLRIASSGTITLFSDAILLEGGTNTQLAIKDGTYSGVFSPSFNSLSDNILRFRNYDSVERMRITAAGLVGIGTSTPKSILEIVGNLSVTHTNGSSGYSEVLFYENNTLQADIFVNGTSNTNYAGANSMNIWQGSNAPIAFYTNGTNERMRITSVGNVGIGTTSPARLLNISGTGTDGTQLQINGTVDSAGIKLIPVTGDAWEIQANVSNQFFVYNRTDSAYRFMIADTGNVLIGTTTDAGYKLDVNGVGRFTNGVIIGSTQAQYATSGGNTYLDYAGTLNIRYNFGAVQALALNSSGAATFSSSVTATTAILSNIKPSINFTLSVNPAFSHSIVGENYSSGAAANNYMDFKVANAANTQQLALRLFGTGAAEFSSSVTATNFIGAGTGLTGTASALSIGGNAAYATTAGALTSMNISQFTNDSGYITSGALAAYLPLAGGTMTGSITSNSVISTSSNIISTGGYISAGGIILQNNYIQATVASGGFWNSNHDVRFYPSAGNIWNITGNAFGLSSFGLNFLDKYGVGNTLKAQIFWSTSELGLKNDTNWVIKANQGGSYGGTLYGAWIVTGSITASANSSISGAVNSAWGLQVINTGTTNANGLYVNIGASSTGVPFRVDKGGAALFDITNAGNATIKGDLTISGSDLFLNGTDVDISTKYNNGAADIQWTLTTDNIFKLIRNGSSTAMEITGVNPLATPVLNIYTQAVNLGLGYSSSVLVFNSTVAGNTWRIDQVEGFGLSFKKGTVKLHEIDLNGKQLFYNISNNNLIGEITASGTSFGSTSGTYTEAYFHVTSAVGATNAMFGTTYPIALGGNYPGIYFNMYYNVGYRIAHGTGVYGAANTYDPINGVIGWLVADTSGNEGTSIAVATQLRLDRLGRVSIGTTASTSEKLYVGGTTFLGGATKISGTCSVSSLTINGALYSNISTVSGYGTLTTTNPSDIRLKEEVETLEYGLKEVMALKPVTYKWKNPQADGKRYTGLIAQDVQEIMPEYVSNISEDDDYLGLDSYAINIVLINAIKELKAEIEILKNK